MKGSKKVKKVFKYHTGYIGNLKSEGGSILETFYDNSVSKLNFTDGEKTIPDILNAILGDYAKVTGAMYRAGNDFIKHLEKVEKLLEKIWEIRKTAELTAQVQGGANQEPDNFAKIEKLAQLFQSGAITEAEFASKKAELLKSIE
jgi:hypothetical protein